MDWIVWSALDWTGTGYGSGTGNGLPVDWIVWTGRDGDWTGLVVVHWIVWTALDWTGTVWVWHWDRTACGLDSLDCTGLH